MFSLKQKELAEWQERNFPRSKYEKLDKKELIDMVIILQTALGMAEEVGEVCHHVLKGSQGIRGGVSGFNRAEIADGVDDSRIYGNQLLSALGVNAEESYSKTVKQVLSRDWQADPSGKNFSQHKEEENDQR